MRFEWSDGGIRANLGLWWVKEGKEDGPSGHVWTIPLRSLCKEQRKGEVVENK